MSTPGHSLLNAHEAATLLGVKVSTIRAWTYQRRLPAIVLGTRAVRYSMADLLEFIGKGRRPPRM